MDAAIAVHGKQGHEAVADPLSTFVVDGHWFMPLIPSFQARPPQASASR